MMLHLLEKIFGSPNERKIRQIEPLVDEINGYEQTLQQLSDEQLRDKTRWFQQELRNRPKELEDPAKDLKLEQELLDTLLPEAFAVCREASRRVLGMRHYDVQLIGGYFLHKGGISEMRTGEGKTLVATLPAYLNALTGKGVHVITVNDYLAKRDADWMGQLYQFLGLTVGTVLSEQRGFDSFQQKKHAYACDITYGTNNEFGFDYLRDNRATTKGQLVQRPFYHAIIDEVDSILIDEARTPLIISGRVSQSAETYTNMAKLAPQFEQTVDYTLDEKSKNIILTEEGIDKAQLLLGVDDLFHEDINLAHHLLCALKAKDLYKCDIDYVVKNDEVVIVDEFTGRLMEGRRWSDGIHQAVEAKEGVHIQDETQTLASITFQNLFRLYAKLSGMTGTAMTEEAEFGKIYNLEVTRIPTNRQDVRQDLSDFIFKSESVKYFKVAESIVEKSEEGRPVLVGTTSIEKSEYLSLLLTNPEHFEQHLTEKAQRFLTTFGTNSVGIALKPLLESLTTLSFSTWLATVGQHQTDINKNGELELWVNNLTNTVRALCKVRDGIAHNVLNAKQHAQEANIIAQAGRLNAVTIATNMAGRGTDILLGGNAEYLVRQDLAEQGIDWQTLPEAELKAQVQAKKQQTEAEREKVQALGGLHIIGTERHESRRIDNQLRGRAGRQGDPGSTQFYLSLEDSLMRLFGGQRISGLMDLLKVEETLPISAELVNKAIEGAQRKVEAYHFDVRKNVLQYDDVLTEQRKLIYAQRKRVLNLENLRNSVQHMVQQALMRCVSTTLTPEYDPQDEAEATVVLATLEQELLQLVPLIEPQLQAGVLKGKTYAQLLETVKVLGTEAYDAFANELQAVTEQLRQEHGVTFGGLEVEEQAELEALNLSAEEMLERQHPLRQIEREMILRVVDARWIDYLHNLDLLRESIGLRAYGQKDPLIEYRREAYELFQRLTYQIQTEVTATLFRSQIQIEVTPTPEMMEAFMAQQQAYEQQQLLESGAGLVDEYGQPVAFPSEALTSNEAAHEAAGGFTPLKPFSAFNQISLSSVSSDASVTNQPMGEPSTPVVTGYLQDVLTPEQYEAKVAAGEITETQGFTPVLMDAPQRRTNTEDTWQV
jgi:preprotein translocase subunit SecA